MRRLARLLGLLVLGCAASAPQAAESSERARIAAERAAIDNTRIERERECQARFAVTRCVEEARHGYRNALAELRRQLAVIDESERRQRAAERIDKLANREAQSVGPPTPRSPRASEARATPRQPAASAVRAEPEPTRLPKPSKARAEPAGGSADARAQEASRAAAFEARVKEAQARRAAVERRNAERAQKGKAARPLPVPASGAAP